MDLHCRTKKCVPITEQGIPVKLGNTQGDGRIRGTGFNTTINGDGCNELLNVYIVMTRLTPRKTSIPVDVDQGIRRYLYDGSLIWLPCAGIRAVYDCHLVNLTYPKG